MPDKLKADMLTAFIGGELTPALAGRVDRQETRIGSRFLSNFIPEIQGGLKKFYGSSLVSVLTDALSGTEYKLVPFDGASEPLTLVFAANKAFVATPSSFYEIPGLHLQSAMMRDCSYLQVNDTLFFASEKNPQFEIRYFGFIDGKHSFGYFNSEFLDVPYFQLGWTGNYFGTITSSAVAGSTGSTAASGYVKLTAGEVKNTYELALPTTLQSLGSSKNVVFENQPDWYITRGAQTSYSGPTPVDVTIGETRIELHRVRGSVDTTVLSATIGQVSYAQNAGYKEAQVNWDVVTGRGSSIRPGGTISPAMKGGGYWAGKTITSQQVVNVLSSQLGSVAISTGVGSKLIFNRLPDGNETGDAYYIAFSQGASSCSDPNAATSFTAFISTMPATPKLYLSAPAYRQEAAASVLVAQEVSFDDVEVNGRRIKFLISDESTNVRAWAQGATYSKNEIVYSDGHYYLASTGLNDTATAGPIQPIHTKGTKSDGNIMWRYLHSGYGTGVITSIPDNKTMYIQVDGTLPILKWGQSTYQWTNFQWSMWGYKGTFPDKVFMFKNRLCYTFNAPRWGSFFQASKTNRYNDFGTEEYGQQLDTSGINIQITGHQDNRINWVLPGFRLYMGSYSGEYNVTGSSSGAISPTACYVLPVSSIGGAPVDALKYEELNMFVGRLNTSIYSLRYDYTTDDYSPDNIGFVGSDLMNEGITRMQALKNDDNNVYFTTGKHNLRLVHNNKEVNLLAFVRANLDGEVLDVASSNQGSRSVLFALVRRTHMENGKPVQVVTVESISADNRPYMLATRSFSYDSEEEVPATLTVPELIGRKVYVCGGTPVQFYHVHVPETGIIPIRYKWPVMAIGIAMPCEAHLNPAIGEKLEGLQQKSVRFIVRLFESGAFSYGGSNDFDRWYDYNNWSIQDGQGWNREHRLMTGDFQLPASFGYSVGQNASGEYPNSTGVGLNIYTDSPEPFNLLLVSNLYV